MSDPNPKPSARESLIIWLKIAAMLAGLFAFGLLVFWLRRATLP